jgi:hypothetical protein
MSIIGKSIDTERRNVFLGLRREEWKLIAK